MRHSAAIVDASSCMINKRFMRQSSPPQGFEQYVLDQIEIEQKLRNQSSKRVMRGRNEKNKMYLQLFEENFKQTRSKNRRSR